MPPPSPFISVVLPCRNEARTLPECIAQLQRLFEKEGWDGEIIVSDNASQDGSAQAALKAGARVVYVPLRGYGRALHAGITAARGELVAFADADLSYPFEHFPLLVAPVQRGEKRLMLGRRLNRQMQAGAMPFLHRRVGTPFLSLLHRTLYGLTIKDCNSGMRVLRRADYPLLHLQSSGMEYASEMLVAAARLGWPVGEADITFCKDRRAGPAHLRPVRDGLRHLRVLLFAPRPKSK